jgi:hypothetical protein
MKFYSPDKSMLIDVRALKEHPEGLVIEGKIMGSMPMKAVLRPEEMRAVFELLTWSLVWRAAKMLLLGSRFSGGSKRIGDGQAKR